MLFRRKALMTETAPTPARVDELALEYDELGEKIRKILAEAKDECQEPDGKLAKLEAELKRLVEQFGSAYEKKSKLLNGVEWEMMLTSSSTVTVDAAAVERFLDWAEGDKKKRAIVDALFTSAKRWDLTPNATVLIQAPGIPAPAKRLFAACLKITPNEPRLRVRKKKAVKQQKTA
jgi:hypothetical protein